MGCCATWIVLRIQFHFEVEGGVLVLAGRLNCFHYFSVCPGWFLWDTWVASSQWLTSEVVVNMERRGIKVGQFFCRAKRLGWLQLKSCWPSCLNCRGRAVRALFLLIEHTTPPVKTALFVCYFPLQSRIMKHNFPDIFLIRHDGIFVFFGSTWGAVGGSLWRLLVSSLPDGLAFQFGII